jgi:hypothetical protein
MGPQYELLKIVAQVLIQVKNAYNLNADQGLYACILRDSLASIYIHNAKKQKFFQP